MTRVRQVTEAHGASVQQAADDRIEQAKAHGRTLGALARAGSVPMDEAEAEIAGMVGDDTELAAVAIAELRRPQ